MFIAQYAAEFNRLSKYCCRSVDTEQNKIRQFIKGLRSELRKSLALFPPNTYSSAVDATTRTENEDKVRFAREAVHPVKKISAKRSAEQHCDKQHWDNKEKWTNGIICRGCKKKGHIEKDCWFKNKQRRCFNCGNSNHKMNECLKLNQFGPKSTNMLNNRIE
jgi:hypothetical protein